MGKQARQQYGNVWTEGRGSDLQSNGISSLLSSVFTISQSPGVVVPETRTEEVNIMEADLEGDI